MTDSPTLPFDPLTIPLSGVNMIEASAGTGKTYGLAALYARLIVLEEKNVAELLVVTYTKAATHELKFRLRHRLSSILRALEENDSIDPTDEFVGNLLAAASAKNLPPQTLIAHLKKQLNHFDEAAIYTIHSFCQTLLRREAFLTGAPFTLEIVTDTAATFELLSADFFRRFLANDRFNSRLITEARRSPKSAYAAVQAYVQKPYLKLEKENLETLREKIQELEKELTTGTQNWRQKIKTQSVEAFKAICLEGNALNKNRFQEATYTRLFETLLSSPGDVPALMEDDDKFVTAFSRFRLKEGFITQKANPDTRKKLEQLFVELEPMAEWADLFREWDDLKKTYVSALQLELIDFLNREIEEYKKKTSKRSFDDLLLDVYSLLYPQTDLTEALLQLTQKTYHFVLIDEFQDTDPLQYRIFARLFEETATPLYLIGDPKQSIYSFRGADIDSYLAAKKEARDFSLTKNYRSHQGLVNFINALFSPVEDPFVNPAIGYPPVTAARDHSNITSPDKTPFTPIELIKLPPEPNKWRQRKAAARSSARTITALLKRRLRYQDRALSPQDIAILVNNHKEAGLMAEALKEENLRSVRIEKASVYQSHEAQTLFALLTLWWQSGFNLPGPELQELLTGRLPFILSSELFNATASDIRAKMDDPAYCGEALAFAQKCLALWEKAGIYTACQYFFRETGLEAPLIAAGKERVLTNLNQLIELLAAAESMANTPYELIEWLKKAIQERGAAADENTLRLESDENLLRIVTIHSAKGLQYPVVLCPFIWAEKNNNEAAGALSARKTDTQEKILRVRDKNEEDSDAIKETGERNSLAEAVRLLYVALTRASDALILFLPDAEIKKNNKDKSEFAGGPLLYLLRAEMAEKNSLWEAWQMRVALYPELKSVVRFEPEFPKKSTPFIPEEENKENARAPSEPQLNYRLSLHTSYSRLSGLMTKASPLLTEDAELPGIPVHSEEEEDTAAETVNHYDAEHPLTLFTFPKGPAIGSFWHEILEGVDFSKEGGVDALIRAKIRQYGIKVLIDLPHAEEKALKLTQDLITRVGTSLLDPGVTLKKLAGKGELVRELDFTLFQEGALKISKINLWLKKIGRADLSFSDPPRLDPKRFYETYLSGFIDLVALFSPEQLYLVDYKSNAIGPTPDAYELPFLDAEMARHHYPLQALLYALAMSRYCQNLNIPVRRFSVRYLFLRGLAADSVRGIWKWDLSDTDMKLLEDFLRSP